MSNSNLCPCFILTITVEQIVLLLENIYRPWIIEKLFRINIILRGITASELSTCKRLSLKSRAGMSHQVSLFRFSNYSQILIDDVRHFNVGISLCRNESFICRCCSTTSTALDDGNSLKLNFSARVSSRVFLELREFSMNFRLLLFRGSNNQAKF